MREPGDQRYAVIPPYPARWFMTQMALGRTVSPAVVAAHAKELQGRKTPEARLAAAQMLGAWRQLEAAALDGEPDEPPVLRGVPRRHQVPRPVVEEPPEGGGAA